MLNQLEDARRVFVCTQSKVLRRARRLYNCLSTVSTTGTACRYVFIRGDPNSLKSRKGVSVQLLFNQYNKNHDARSLVLHLPRFYRRSFYCIADRSLLARLRLRRHKNCLNRLRRRHPLSAVSLEWTIKKWPLKKKLNFYQQHCLISLSWSRAWWRFRRQLLPHCMYVRNFVVY